MATLSPKKFKKKQQVRLVISTIICMSNLKRGIHLLLTEMRNLQVEIFLRLEVKYLK